MLSAHVQAPKKNRPVGDLLPIPSLSGSGLPSRLPQNGNGEHVMTTIAKNVVSKVPEVNLAFWIIKVIATTLGETGGDAVSMSMHLGYAISSGIFLGIFVVAVAQAGRAPGYWKDRG
jgi:hypothetical protein